MILFMLLFSQYYFGQNKIQYGQFEWFINETEHFEIYYYKSGEVLIPFAEDVLEEAYDRLKERFSYRERKNEEKIPVLIYKSHPDFEGTNVIMERIPEAVGGFTEIFKNRIVLPFNGSYSDFRHILNHELVHVFQYRILYGRGMGAIRNLATLRIPLWFIEGMAEFESMGWDESAETFIRDAVLNDRLYPISILNYAGGYIVYKEGQSILYFIKNRYGEKKIGELMNKIKVTGSLTGAIRQVLGIDEDKLSEEWIKSLKKEYWPLIGVKEDVNDITMPIVTHKEFKNIYNYAPSISPAGDVIVYYTDRAEEVQIRIVSALNGEDLGLLIRGGRSPKFESLHLMDGHLDFSQDGKYIVFPALERGKDVLYIYDVGSRKAKDRVELPLDRIRWPEWSPDGSMITFMGLNNGASDIYVYNLLDGSLTNITHDRYSDGEPTWKGDSILFVSDRPAVRDWDYS
ncbi:PD40 domain-containing protein, partial [candidate division WOR-3 bacterium]|nr:PD40 domain-containing protein [candidate division WOR-3 bacterium]